MNYGILDKPLSDGGVVIARFVAPLSIRSNKPSFISDSMSLKRVVSERPAQRWEITTNLEPLTSSANDLFVMLVTTGLTSILNILVPQNIGVIRERELGFNADAVAQGNLDASTVVLTTFTDIPKGTFIKFEGQNKVYMTTTDKNYASGATVGIYPPLRATVSSSTPFKWQDDVEMRVFLDNETAIGMSFTDGILMDNGEVRFVEAL